MFNLQICLPKSEMNLDLKLFSKGTDKKHNFFKDIYRAMVFLSKKKFNEIVSFASEHISVKIGKFCKKYNKKVKLISTKDKILFRILYKL